MKNIAYFTLFAFLFLSCDTVVKKEININSDPAVIGTWILDNRESTPTLAGNPKNGRIWLEYIEAHNKNEASFSKATDQTGLARFGSLSISFVLLYLFPLIIILIGYDSYTKEKEQQTYLLLKSQGIHPVKLLFGKWIAIIIPIFSLTVIVFISIAILVSNNQAFTFFNWSSIASCSICTFFSSFFSAVDSAFDNAFPSFLKAFPAFTAFLSVSQ